jgi:hypothetical protein
MLLLLLLLLLLWPSVLPLLLLLLFGMVQSQQQVADHDVNDLQKLHLRVACAMWEVAHSTQCGC